MLVTFGPNGKFKPLQISRTLMFVQTTPAPLYEVFFDLLDSHFPKTNLSPNVKQKVQNMIERNAIVVLPGYLTSAQYPLAYWLFWGGGAFAHKDSV